MNEKEVTFNVKYEIVLYTPVFNARWGGSTRIPLPCFTVFNMGEPPKKVLKCKKKT